MTSVRRSNRRQSDDESRLPEPNRPITRWFGGACAALWAVGVQSAPDPWSKLLAIITPGIGYFAGHGLDTILSYYDDGGPIRERTRLINSRIAEVKKSIILIEKEFDRVKRTPSGEKIASMYESMLIDANKKLASIIKSSLNDPEQPPKI